MSSVEIIMVKLLKQIRKFEINNYFTNIWSPNATVIVISSPGTAKVNVEALLKRLGCWQVSA